MSRYYRRRRNGSSIPLVALALMGFAIYTYAKAYEHLMPYILITFLLIIFLVVLLKIRKRRIKTQNQTSIMHTEQVIDAMTPLEFEKYVAARLAEKGYTNIQLTEYYDWGVDIIAHKDGVIWGVQMKQCSGRVKVAAVRQVVTALKKYHCDRAMVVTNGRYSRQAIELAKSNNCLLAKL